MLTKKPSNLDNYLKQQISPIFKTIVNHYSDTTEAVITEPSFWEGNWGTTYRQNGEVVVGGYRNIVDTGELRDSKQVKVADFSATITWNSDHALKVFFPQPRQNGGVTPGRDWIKRAKQQYQTIF